MTELTHAMALERLETGDSINLLDMKNLSYADLDKLFEDIKFWKIHGKSDFNLTLVELLDECCTGTGIVT